MVQPQCSRPLGCCEDSELCTTTGSICLSCVRVSSFGSSSVVRTPLGIHYDAQFSHYNPYSHLIVLFHCWLTAILASQWAVAITKRATLLLHAPPKIQTLSGAAVRRWLAKRIHAWRYRR